MAMLAMDEMGTHSWTHQVGSFGWRHKLAWRQLSILWDIPMSHHLQNTLATTSKNDAPHSIALARGEYDDQFLQHCHRLRGPKVFFLDRVRVSFRRAGAGFAIADENYYQPGSCFGHVFRVKKGHSLTAGLPEKVSIYGACPVVTPLEIEDEMDVLVSLNGIAVVAKRGRDVVFGADPWQLGVPSVPMVYKLLSNWLHHELGLKHRDTQTFRNNPARRSANNCGGPKKPSTKSRIG